MIRYKIDVMKQLKAKGYSTYRLEKEKLIHSEVISSIKKGALVSWNNMSTICSLLQCQPGDVVQFSESEEQHSTSKTFIPVAYPQRTPSLKIRQVAKKKGLKMKDIAASTNQSPANLSNKLSADNLTYSDMIEISDAIGCALDVILVDKETGQVT